MSPPQPSAQPTITDLGPAYLEQGLIARRSPDRPSGSLANSASRSISGGARMTAPLRPGVFHTSPTGREKGVGARQRVPGLRDYFFRFPVVPPPTRASEPDKGLIQGATAFRAREQTWGEGAGGQYGKQKTRLA